MLKCIKITSEHQIINKEFSFLSSRGFEFSFENVLNVIDKYKFSKYNGTDIIICNDIREHFINLQIVQKKTKILLSLDYGAVMNNGSFVGLDELLSKINEIYQCELKRYRYSKKIFADIISLYVNFIQLNIEMIDMQE